MIEKSCKKIIALVIQLTGQIAEVTNEFFFVCWARQLIHYGEGNTNACGCNL
ncbi:hypothetical protein SPD48_06715 [Pseudogracilibacillus sp. SE30717A]|uniref:hypothetical protein n=1 Tax=Pseudogracilibacillus sp. SE30717A TaxID=3098293 RepID=UPI00300DFDCE